MEDRRELSHFLNHFRRLFRELEISAVWVVRNLKIVLLIGILLRLILIGFLMFLSIPFVRVVKHLDRNPAILQYGHTFFLAWYQKVSPVKFIFLQGLV